MGKERFYLENFSSFIFPQAVTSASPPLPPPMSLSNYNLFCRLKITNLMTICLTVQMLIISSQAILVTLKTFFTSFQYYIRSKETTDFCFKQLLFRKCKQYLDTLTADSVTECH
jgi:hypothetical protein